MFANNKFYDWDSSENMDAMLKVTNVIVVIQKTLELLIISLLYVRLGSQKSMETTWRPMYMRRLKGDTIKASVCL